MDKQLKVPKGYSLDPHVISWATQTAARMTIETGEKVSDSKLVNDILTVLAEDEAHLKKLLAKVQEKK